MTTLLWIIPASILNFVLMIVCRRLLLNFTKFSHVVILVVAVIFSTGVAAFGTYALLPGNIAIDITEAMLIGGFVNGFFLTAVELREPHNR